MVRGQTPSSTSALSIEGYLSPVSFWEPCLIVGSAWLEHAPFAFWLTNALRPKMLVELGTKRGFSYFAFCQAVKALSLGTRCYAIDTWEGDEHGGFYDEEIFKKVHDHNRLHYGAFSELVRLTFEDAVMDFEDGTIDCLHIDGRHLYDDVKRDFETWQTKLSDRAVVLLHDTNARNRNFGVSRFWREIRATRPSFEFLHGHGLGVMGHGSVLPEELSSLFESALVPAWEAEIRQTYARLGERIKAKFDRRTLKARLRAGEAAIKDVQARLDSERARRIRETRELKESKSWRITAPLRAVSGGLRRLLANTQKGSN